MSNVIVDKTNLDLLANAIITKSGEDVAQMTIGEMIEAVDGIESGGITPTGNIDITQAGVTNVTSYATATVPTASPYIECDGNEFYTDENVRWWHIYPSLYVDESEGDTAGWLADGTHLVGQATAFRAVPSNITITPSTSSQTVGGYNYMMEGAVTVSAMPSGTAGTPTATKGAVSNHSVSVTPSVTNTTGYITGSTKTGTAVTVSASELVSGTYSVTSSGTKDVTNYASASVPAGTEGTPTATKGSVSNHSVSVTPSVTNSAGYITGGTHTGTAVTVTASELASGNKAITENGTNIDVVGYSTVSVSVSGGGGGSVTQDANGYIVLPSTGGGGGGGGSAQTATGTFSGNGTISATISCSFAPDLILVHGDLSGTASLRGVVHFLIIKDTEALIVVDGSSSAYTPSLYHEAYGITGYGSAPAPYASYSGTTLTLNMVDNTSSTRWTSGITYEYTLVKWTS